MLIDSGAVNSLLSAKMSKRERDFKELTSMIWGLESLKHVGQAGNSEAGASVHRWNFF